MQLGMVGLGRMGGNIVRRLMRAGHSCVVFDKSTEAVRRSPGKARREPRPRRSRRDSSTTPRAVWVMLPAGAITEQIVRARRPARAGRHRDRRRQHASSRTTSARAEMLRDKGIRYLDVGTSAAASGGSSAATA